MNNPHYIVHHFKDGDKYISDYNKSGRNEGYAIQEEKRKEEKRKEEKRKEYLKSQTSNRFKK